MHTIDINKINVICKEPAATEEEVEEEVVQTADGKIGQIFLRSRLSLCYVDVADLDGKVEEEELEISGEDLKTLMDSLAKTTLESFQVLDMHDLIQYSNVHVCMHFQAGMIQKIKEKEDVMASRLSKLEKTLNSNH